MTTFPMYTFNHRKSNANSQLQTQFSPRIRTIFTFVEYHTVLLYVVNGGYFKIVGTLKTIKFVHMQPYNFKKYFI